MQVAAIWCAHEKAVIDGPDAYQNSADCLALSVKSQESGIMT